MIGPKQILLSMTGAVVIHIALVIPWLAAEEGDGAIAEGKDGLQVSVGLAGSFTEAAEKHDERIDNSLQDEAKPQTQKPVELKEEPKPELEQESEQATPQKMEPKPLPKQEVKPEPKAESKSEPKTEPVAKQTAEPEPQPKPAPEPEEERTEQPEKIEQAEKIEQIEETETVTEQTDAETTDQQSDDKKAVQAPSTKATGVGDRIETGGNPAVRQSYQKKVLSRIAKAKRYPRSARKDGVTGTATVTFVIQRNGRISQARIVKSSGDERLDQEALEMLQRASPFPPLPSDLGQSSLALTLPIEFSLNTKRKLF